MTFEEIAIRKDRQRVALQENLDNITRQLQELGALRIILFGSFATGKIHSWSDLDIVVIMPATKTSKEWKEDIYNNIDWNVGCDLLVYTMQEFESMLPVSRFLRYALQQGKVIYDTRPQK